MFASVGTSLQTSARGDPLSVFTAAQHHQQLQSTLSKQNGKTLMPPPRHHGVMSALNTAGMQAPQSMASGTAATPLVVYSPRFDICYLPLAGFQQPSNMTISPWIALTGGSSNGYPSPMEPALAQTTPPTMSRTLSNSFLTLAPLSTGALALAQSYKSNASVVPSSSNGNHSMSLLNGCSLGTTMSPSIATKRLALPIPRDGGVYPGGENDSRKKVKLIVSDEEKSTLNKPEDDEEEDAPDTDSASYQEDAQPALHINHDQRQPKFGLGGQKRLSITFSNLGSVTPNPERFGKYGLVIPDQLSGTHTMYSQDWKFKIEYNTTTDKSGSDEGEDTLVLLTWCITNLTSGKEVVVTETPQQAAARRVKGKTICNLVVKKALELRATDLEQALEKLSKTPGANPMQFVNLESMIRKLRPRQCTEGLLFFGLRHDIIQSRFKNPKGE